MQPADDRWEHTRVFIDDVRNRKKPFANLQSGHCATYIGYLFNPSRQVAHSI